MNVYVGLLFVHVLGAVGLVAALAVEAVAVSGLRRAGTAVVARGWARLRVRAGRGGGLAMLVTVLAGAGLMRLGWNHTPWITGAAAALLVGSGVHHAVRRRRDRPLAEALAAATTATAELPAGVRALATSRALALDVSLRIALAIGIIALMTVRPGPTGSLAIVAAMLGVGVVAGLVAGARRTRERRSRDRRPGMLAPGAIVADRELVAISGERVAIPDATRTVHLQLRRFAGCPVCDLHLRSIIRRHDEIRAAGIREVVVFHSTVDELRKHAAHLPLALIADPGKRLYRDFGAESSPWALLDPRAWPTIAVAVLRTLLAVLRRAREIPPINPGGGRFGLPAELLIAPDGTVLASKYGEHAADHWSVSELLALPRGGRAVALVRSS